ncbi:MAG: DUF2207 domain-containing protein [Planctomycetes bacterium]|nr:DUF2207 domain-containing protein [Planctomycetota bacterium]
MLYQKRRTRDLILTIVSSILIGVFALAVALAAREERIAQFQATAVVHPSGLARVTEVIDYDFGAKSRHGIYRDIPGLLSADSVKVESATAPASFQIIGLGNRTRMRIGDANKKIRGRHRYRIEYDLLVRGFDAVSGEDLGWNAIGTGWNVEITNIEIHVLAKSRLDNVFAVKGTESSDNTIPIALVEDGHAALRLDRLKPHEGVSIFGQLGPKLDVPPEPPAAFAAPVASTAVPVSFLAFLTGLAGLAAALVSGYFVRRSGRERVWIGGSVDAAFGPHDRDDASTILVDHDELAAMATTEFVPPKGLHAWQGGIMYDEHVEHDHLVAWLLERAIEGEFEIIEADGELHLKRDTDALPDDEILRALFGSRTEVRLVGYDKQFAAGWTKLRSELERWHLDSEYWDPDGDRRRQRVRVFGFLGCAAGLVLLAASAANTYRAAMPWTPLALLGAMVALAALSCLIRSWELRVRTPEGSGKWILVESFRRFIEKSDARHVENAARVGRLLEYTAWAVALHEVDHWSRAIDDAQLADHVAPATLQFVHFAPTFSSVVRAAAIAPSSSSSSGGGSFGSVGGGGGGGGGGSW